MRETRDDAAVAWVSDDLCLVQMVDFLTAIVDTPYWSVEASLVGRLMVKGGA